MFVKEKKPLSDLIKMQMDSNNSIPLNVYELRNFIYYGFEDKKLRPKYWKILLSYYSENKYKSDSYYAKARESYHQIETLENEQNKIFNDILDKDIERTSLLTDEFKEYAKPIKNILLKFSATNASIGYVQGMIYVAIPLLHVMMTSDSLDDRKYAEEDSFYLFHNLMGEINKSLCEFFDDAPDGIKYKIKQVYEIILEKDPELYKSIKDKELLETAFPLKWILQLFTNFYPTDEILYLWDKIFSDAYKYEIISYLCASFVLLKRDSILQWNFVKCMEFFDSKTDIPTELLFKLADELRRSNKPIKEVLKDKKFKIKKKQI